MLGTFPAHVPLKSLFEVWYAKAAIRLRLLESRVRSGAVEALPLEIVNDGYIEIGTSAWRSLGAECLILAYIHPHRILLGILVIRAE